eukprot:COSAG05_NODE_1210_length_5500_cov_84.214960_8_plen_52_part_00
MELLGLRNIAYFSFYQKPLNTQIHNILFSVEVGNPVMEAILQLELLVLSKV